jgi:predicted DCC family thiol-disulfide oxidoreductase YuxK
MNWEWGKADTLLIYDGICGLCQKSVAWLKERDKHGRLAFVPLQAPGILERFAIPHEEAMQHLHAINQKGRKRKGADAVLWAVSLLPRYRWLRLLWIVPGALPLSRWVYKQVAKRRHLLFK